VFVQVIQGRVADRDELAAQQDRWVYLTDPWLVSGRRGTS
jgi:hypothetical protein